MKAPAQRAWTARVPGAENGDPDSNRFRARTIPYYSASAIILQVPMNAHNEALLRVHAGCCNGHELDALMGHYGPQTRAILDGCLVGEGPDGVRKALQAEFGQFRVGRVQSLDGEAVLVEYDREGREPKAILRLEAQGGRVSEVRIVHDADMVRRLARAASN